MCNPIAKIAFLSVLVPAFWAQISAADDAVAATTKSSTMQEAATQSTSDEGRVYRVTNLLIAMSSAKAGGIVGFKTKMINVSEPELVPSTLLAGGLGDDIIRIDGTYSLLKPIFGGERLPKFGEVYAEKPIHLKHNPMHPNSIEWRLYPLLPYDKDEPKERFFILIVPGEQSDLLDCTFVGPIPRNELPSVENLVRFIKENPKPDKEQIAMLVQSKDLWLQTLGKVLESPGEK